MVPRPLEGNLAPLLAGAAGLGWKRFFGVEQRLLLRGGLFVGSDKIERF